jgi:signal peptidase I
MRLLHMATTGLRRVLDILLMGLIVVVLFGLLLGKLVPLTGHQTIIVGGSSMEPAIGLGSAIVLTPVRAPDLAVSQVVSLHAGAKNALYTHRIIEVLDLADGRWIRTKGDANADADPTLIAASAVAGRVDVAIPYAGYLIALLSIPTGIVFLIGLAALLLAATWLLDSLELERAEQPAATGVTDVTALPTLSRNRPPILSRAERLRRARLATGSMRRIHRRPS